MKNSLCLLRVGLLLSALCSAWPGYAQTSDALRTEMNRIFQNVNATPVSSGLLWDYGLELTDVVKFNGTLRSDNYISIAEWRLLYTSLYTMRFNSNISLSNPTTVSDQIENYGKQSTAHNIVALHMRYQKFRSDATSKGVTISNNQLSRILQRIRYLWTVVLSPWV